MNKFVKLVSAMCALATLAACQTTASQKRESGQDAISARQPNSPVSQTRTNFSDALTCMDDLFLKYGTGNAGVGIAITSNGISDETGEIFAGTRDMLITGISKMSRKSRAFKYIDYSAHDLLRLYKLEQRSEYNIPDFYLRGAITQLDSRAVSEGAGGGFTAFGISLGAGVDANKSVISVDMSVGGVKDAEILPYTSSSNSMVTALRGRALDADLKGSELFNESFGVNIDISQDKSEGNAQAVRNLIEFGLIETLGKFTQVPYWRCIGIAETNRKVAEQIDDWYYSMADAERINFAQSTLSSLNYYFGPEDGVMSDALGDAIGRYQAASGLQANEQIDIDFYRSLVKNEAGADGNPPSIGSLDSSPVASHAGLEAKLTILKEPNKPKLEPEEQYAFRVAAGSPSFVYCYYEDGNSDVYRVFPNRFEPNALLTKNRIISLGYPKSLVKFFAGSSGSKESLVCFSSSTEVGLLLPTHLKGQDLEPLPLNGGLLELAKIYSDRESATSPITVTAAEYVVE